MKVMLCLRVDMVKALGLVRQIKLEPHQIHGHQGQEQMIVYLS